MKSLVTVSRHSSRYTNVWNDQSSVALLTKALFHCYPLSCRPDEEIVHATMIELERLFPNEVRADGSMAKVRGSVGLYQTRNTEA